MSEEEPIYNGIPINLFLTGRSCLVVGGGKVALRKIQLLLDAGAEVMVVSPERSIRAPLRQRLGLSRR